MSTDLSEFRDETRTWLESNCPESQRQPVKRDEVIWPGRCQKFPSEDGRLWFERMRDNGWTCPGFPAEYGGGGLDNAKEKILREELTRLRCRPPLTDLGISMLGPALLEFGTDEQKREHIPKIVRGERRWCQGYSEPGAGSDLASLQCSAEDQNDHFLVNGSKIWTSFGTESDWIFCLVRTNKEGRKQDGISFLLIDMQTPGLKAEPIDLISGESEFAQVFFDDVTVPKRNLVGEINKGWTIAKTLLKHERKMMSELGAGFLAGGLTLAQAARQYLNENDGDQIEDPLIRNSVAQHEMNMRAIALTGYRTHQEDQAQQIDPNVPLIMKYLGTSEVKVKDELMVDIMGLQGMGWCDDSFNQNELRANRELLFNKALTIAGGTNEIQLNIIARHALGLPQE